MPFDFNRITGLFDPRRLYPQDRAMDNRNIFDPYYGQNPDPYERPPAGIGQTPTGSVFSAPDIRQPPSMAAAQQQSPLQQATPNAIDSSGDFDAEGWMNKILSRLYTPSHEASDRLNQMIANQPQRPTDISKWRKLGSLMVGMGQGPEAQEKATYAPYYRQLADWKTGIEPALKAGELERYSNANERQLAVQTAAAMTREEAEKRRLTKSQADIARDKKKNQLTEFHYMHPDWTKEQGSNGNVWLVPPRPDLGKPYDTGLRDSDFTDQEQALEQEKQIKMRNDAAMARTRVGAGPKSKILYTEDPQTGHREAWQYDPNAANPEDRLTPILMPDPTKNIIPPGIPEGYRVTNVPGMTPSGRQDEIQTRAARAISAHPEWPRNAIIYQNGQPIISPRIKDPDLRKQIEAEIYGDTPSAINRNQPVQSNRPPNAPKGGRMRQVPGMQGVYEVEVP